MSLDIPISVRLCRQLQEESHDGSDGATFFFCKISFLINSTPKKITSKPQFITKIHTKIKQNNNFKKECKNKIEEDRSISNNRTQQIFNNKIVLPPTPWLN